MKTSDFDEIDIKEIKENLKKYINGGKLSNDVSTNIKASLIYMDELEKDSLEAWISLINEQIKQNHKHNDELKALDSFWQANYDKLKKDTIKFVEDKINEETENFLESVEDDTVDGMTSAVERGIAYKTVLDYLKGE